MRTPFGRPGAKIDKKSDGRQGMKLNPAWKMASVVVAVCLAWTSLGSTAFAQEPAETAAKREGAAPLDLRVAVAAPFPLPAPSRSAVPPKAQAASGSKKSKWWVLAGIAAASVATAVVISRHQADEPTITGLDPCIGAGC
jgi:hypothetical protein